jgi:transposase
MRGKPDSQPPMFFAICMEDRVRQDHPLRPIKRMVDDELSRMSRQFGAAYANTGRPSVPPERLLKALLLQSLYSIRSENQLCERIDTDLLFRWFLDMDPAEPMFDATAFTHNRPRLEDHGLTAAFFDGVVRQAMRAGLTSDDHFSVDGTLIESYASIKSFVAKDDQGRPTGGDGNGY